MEERESDIVEETEERMERAQDSGDKERLETLEEVHRSLESELDEGAETPPA
jgi:hypothetical protein